MTERCPTCGSLVRVVSSDEGTSHYEPTPVADRLFELTGLVQECYGQRVSNGGYIPSELGDRLRRALKA